MVSSTVSVWDRGAAGGVPRPLLFFPSSVLTPDSRAHRGAGDRRRGPLAARGGPGGSGGDPFPSLRLPPRARPTPGSGPKEALGRSQLCAGPCPRPEPQVIPVRGREGRRGTVRARTELGLPGRSLLQCRRPAGLPSTVVWAPGLAAARDLSGTRAGAPPGRGGAGLQEECG